MCFVLKHKNGYEIVVEDKYDKTIEDSLRASIQPTRLILSSLGGEYSKEKCDLVKHEGLPPIDRAVRNSLWYTVRVAWKVMYHEPTTKMQDTLKQLIQMTGEELAKLSPAELEPFLKGSP